MININKYWPLGFLALILFVYFTLRISEISFKSKIKKNAKEVILMEFSSVIKNKFIDSNYRMHLFFDLEDIEGKKKHNLDVTQFRLGTNIWIFSDIGATLIKHKNDSFFIVKNIMKNDTFIVNLHN